MNLHFWDKFDLCNRQYLLGSLARREHYDHLQQKFSSALDICGMGIFIKAIPYILKVINRFWTVKEVFRVSFGTSDNYVNTLIMADFNLFSRAIQGDTHRFESKKRFIEVRKKHLSFIYKG